MLYNDKHTIYNTYIYNACKFFIWKNSFDFEKSAMYFFIFNKILQQIVFV